MPMPGIPSFVRMVMEAHGGSKEPPSAQRLLPDGLCFFWVLQLFPIMSCISCPD